MLLFFLLCTLLQSLWGKPLPAPLGRSFEVAANATCTTSGDQCPALPDNGGQQLRSVYDVVQSCFFTIFACVWTSIHPDVNDPRHSLCTNISCRVYATLIAVIAPEIVLLEALHQRFAAKAIADQYNGFKTLGEPKTSIWAKFKQLFQRPPDSILRRGASVRQPWTITHGFFIQMGGFFLYEDELPTEALTYDRLAALLRQGVIDLPSVTERELQDRSKGNIISKGIIVLQTTWFVLQCIVRVAQHLPLSELEVLTLAFAVVNLAIYVAWWRKPQDVDTVICVPLKHPANRATNSDPVTTNPSQADSQQQDDNKPLIQYGEGTDKMQGEDIHVGEQDSSLYTYIAYIIGTIFGAIHLFGWSLEFSLPRDRVLWQISAVVLTTTPFIVFLGLSLADYNLLEVLRLIVALIPIVFIPFYIVARLIVIVLAFKAILHPPHNVLLDVSWTCYIPHF